MIRKISFFILVLALAAGCSDNSKTTLNITAESVQEIVISKLQPQDIVKLDTLKSTKGNFIYSLKVDTPTFMMVSTTDNFRMPVFVDKEQDIEINITKDGKGHNYTVSGSPETERIRRINAIVKKASHSMDSINNIAQSSKDSANFGQTRQQLQAAFENKVNEAREKLLALIDEKPGSLANLFVFPQTLGNFQLVPADKYMGYYEKVDSAINKNYKGNPHSRFFSDQLVKLKKQVAQSKKTQKAKSNIKVGKPAPEIAMENPQGEVMKLSDLRGKVVLVDFWAAWCKPCRMANPKLVKLYNEYKDNGFRIFSVSLDGLQQQPNPEKSWKRAIKKDGLKWDTHVSDLKGWRSQAVKDYGFTGIPFTVLVGRDGNILATNLRGGALRDKLSEIFAAG